MRPRVLPPGGTECSPSSTPFTRLPYMDMGESWYSLRVFSTVPLKRGSCGRSWLSMKSATSHAS